MENVERFTEGVGVEASRPAYFYLLVEAMIDAGILLGLPRAGAAELIIQTAVGSARKRFNVRFYLIAMIAVGLSVYMPESLVLAKERYGR